METDKVMQLDPAKVLADPATNPRFGTKKTRVESIKANITEVGGVLVPVEVVALTGDKKHTHQLVTGFTRHAAVLSLNEEGAGLTLPAVVRDVPEGLQRLKHQLAENMERENLSPMDQAVAIKRLFDAGVQRQEIMRVFARPGGRKGLQLQPASNAYLNMTLSFLDLPKPIQEKIHDGRVGVAAAYELTKVTPEKRQIVLDRAEADRIRQIESEEKEDKRIAEAEAKIEQAKQEEQQVAINLDNAKREVKAAEELVEAKHAVAAEAYEGIRLAVKGKAGKAKAEAEKVATEHFQAAEVDVKGAEKVLASAQKVLDKLQGKAKVLETAAASHKGKLADARKAAAKKAPANKKPVGAAAVKKAAQAEGEGDGRVPLPAKEMRDAIEKMALPGSYPMVMEIAKAILECFNSVITPKELYNTLAVLTGERTATDKTSKELPKKKPAAA